MGAFLWSFIFEGFEKSDKKIQVWLKCDKNNGLCTWRPMYIYDCISLNSETGKSQTKVLEKIKTHILCSIIFFFFWKLFQSWDNVEKYCWAGQATYDNIIWCMRIAWWIPKATDTHSEYVTYITVPLQQWLYEHASMLRYMYTVCLVIWILKTETAASGSFTFSVTAQRAEPFREQTEAYL